MRRIAIFVDEALEALVHRNKLLLILSLGLALLYYLLFAYQANFTDTAELARDSWSYQSIAVNFANGHGFHRAGEMGEFEDYKFAENYNKRYHNKFLVYAGVPDLQRNLGYPLFVSVIYKIVGVHPLVVKYIQLLLFVLVAASLPWIGRNFWGKIGLVSGIIAGIIFLMGNAYVAGQIMTESLIIFTLFLIVVAAINHVSRGSRASALLLGLTLGISLLVKGSLIFIPLLLVGQMAYKSFKSREKKGMANLVIVVLFAALPVLPWTMYININERSVKQSLAEIKEVVFDESLSITQKRDMLDERPDIIGKGFLPDRNLSGDEMVLLRDSILPAVRKTGFMLTGDVLGPIDKMALLEQITSAPSINLLRVFVIRHQLLDGHNEYMKDGGVYPDWRFDPNSFYNKDEMEDAPSALRVLRFYGNHPVLIFKLAWMKIISAMSQFIFLWVILMLMVLEPIAMVVKNYTKAMGLKIALTSVLLLVVLSSLFVPFGVGLGLSISFWLSAAIVITVLTKRRHMSLELPYILLAIFINFTVLSIVAIGLARWTMVMDFLITLTGCYYLLKFILDSIKEIQTGVLEEQK